MKQLAVQPLTAAAFRPYGDVIEPRADAPGHAINAGSAWRFEDLCELQGPHGRFSIGIVRAQARQLPLRVSLLERHRLGSQVFLPAQAGDYLVVVAQAGERPSAADLRCFHARGGQGVHYRPGTWHHPLLALAAMDFTVIDQVAPLGAVDCEEVRLDGPEIRLGA